MPFIKLFFKNRCLLLLLFNCFSITSIAQTTPGNPTDDLKNTEKIIMVGNSITYQGDWQKLLNRNDVTNWGIPGYTTQQISWTIKNLIPKKPAVCFLEGGINDLTLGIKPKRVFLNQIKVIDTLISHKIIPVVQSTIYQHQSDDKNKRVRKVNKLISKYCNKNNIEYIDLNKVLSVNNDLKKEFTNDGTHLTKEAYVQWAVLVTEKLKKLRL